MDGLTFYIFFCKRKRTKQTAIMNKEYMQKQKHESLESYVMSLNMSLIISGKQREILHTVIKTWNKRCPGFLD